MSHPHLFEQLLNEPNRVLDMAVNELQLKCDAELSRTLRIPKAAISRARHGLRPLGYTILIRILEATDLTVKELYELAMAQPSTLPVTATGEKKRSARGKLRPLL